MQTDRFHYKSLYYPPGGILMWIIIILELFTFGIALIALVKFSKEDPQLYHESRLRLNSTYGAINTAILLISGFFMATTVYHFKNKHLTKTRLYLKLTILGGVLFLVLKSIEYYQKMDAGYALDYNTFYTFYWLLTGFHVIHVIVGMVILSYLYFSLNHLSMEDMEAGAAFWHMCDLIWLLLFPVIYLIL